ncbi:MAG: carboxypeptidase-like regulatory domain-containing protein [Balneola sp.]
MLLIEKHSSSDSKMYLKRINLFWNRIVLLIYFSFSSLMVFSQNLKGVVINEKGDAIPYVNIGKEGTSYGAVSYEDGTFIIGVNQAYIQDSLTFSAIGYKSKKVSVSELIRMGFSTIILEIKTYQIEELFVEGKRLRSKTIGPRKSSFDTAVLLVSEQGGNAMGLKISPKKDMFKISRASVFLKAADSTRFQLRVRFFENRNGLPGEEFTPQNILINSIVKEGRIWVDLSSFDIYYTDSFFIVFEWVHTKELAEAIQKILSNFGLSFSELGKSRKKDEILPVFFRVRDDDKRFSPVKRFGSQGEWKISDKRPLISVEIEY